MKLSATGKTTITVVIDAQLFFPDAALAQQQFVLRPNHR
jgi:hypothetical protein